MLIEQIKLTNFGKHRDLDFNLGSTANVVGLLGTNGSGKSTILEALKYGFTGDLSGGTLESYKSVNSDKNGEVEISFIKGGTKGIIKRQVGKGRLKTSFKWGGQKALTAKKTVGALLQEILGVDKKALANAIFLPQGQLDTLLFGTKTEREELFVKLVNMSYCQRRAETLALKSKQLKSSVQNLAATLDEINKNDIAALNELTSISAEIINAPDYSNIIEHLRAKQELDNNIETKSVYLTEGRADLTILSQQITNAKEGLRRKSIEAGHSDGAEFDDVANLEKAKYNEAINKRTELVSELNRIQNRDKLIERRKVTKQEETTAESDLAELLNKKIVPTVTQESLDVLKLRVGELKFEAEQMAKWRDKMKDLAAKKVSSITCPVCQSEDACAYDADLPEFDKLVENKKTALSLMEQSLESQKKEFHAYERAISVHAGKIERTNWQIIKVQEEHDKIQKELHNYEGLENEDIAREILKAVNCSITMAEEFNEQFVKDLYELNNLEANLISTTITIDDLVSSIAKDEEAVAKLPGDSINGHDIEDLRDLEARQSVRTALLGSLTHAQTTYETIRDRKSHITQQVEKDKNTLIVASELDTLSTVFARKGLPREYVIMKFQKLMEETSRKLEILNADFTISYDSDSPLSFLFQRYDGDEHVELPMAKLSGGQRVRLCTAFLLACQKELVSNVGLMTFDEPSTHLDTEGVDSLRVLFETLQQLFDGSEYQIWISDHHPTLETAFNKTLKLL